MTTKIWYRNCYKYIKPTDPIINQRLGYSFMNSNPGLKPLVKLGEKRGVVQTDGKFIGLGRTLYLISYRDYYNTLFFK